jgi:DNA-binding NarL/FixJ family response regulator
VGVERLLRLAYGGMKNLIPGKLKYYINELQMVKGSMKKSTIAIVDSHDLTRFGIRIELKSMSEFQVVGEARNGLEALKLMPIAKPDVMMLGMNFWDFEVKNLLPQLKQICDHHSLKTKFLVAGLEENDRTLAFALGADAFALKGTTTQQDLRKLLIELCKD